MPTVELLQPTLWRTCRVLANRTRLRILALLVKDSPQTVAAVACRLQLTLPVASQALRALEARGLLAVRRTGRRVQYRFGSATTGAARKLVAALPAVFGRGPTAIDTLFRLCTAFTHPRRIEVFKTLQRQDRTLRQLQAATRISEPALWRHLRKLEVRGFVRRRRRGVYSATIPPEAFGLALVRMAIE